VSGFEKDTTNNRMELVAAINALKMLKEPCEVDLYSDSAYLVNGFLQNWVEKWKKNGWKTSNKEEVKNMEKGHSDNEYNNRCDKLATDEIKKKNFASQRKRSLP